MGRGTPEEMNFQTNPALQYFWRASIGNLRFWIGKMPWSRKPFGESRPLVGVDRQNLDEEVLPADWPGQRTSELSLHKQQIIPVYCA
jgi:hypothetical protein